MLLPSGEVTATGMVLAPIVRASGPLAVPEATVTPFTFNVEAGLASTGVTVMLATALATAAT